MNEWNNYETLEHYEGKIWISKIFKSENRGNICYWKNDDFHVVAYISPDMLENKDFDSIVKEVLEARGLTYMLEEEIITCSICGKIFNEADVNIVDYIDDVCVNCEKSYQGQI